MSPTLLEIVIAILLLLLAWQIGVIIAPRLVVSFLSFWKSSRPRRDPGSRGSEKNITPPASPDGKTL